MAKKISILGSTGSIGVQALDVAKNLGLDVVGISGNLNIALLTQQALEFRPKIITVGTDIAAKELSDNLSGLGIEVHYGIEGLIAVATLDEVDTVLTSVVGTVGLIPTLHAIRKKKHIALANKETLVAAGSIVMAEARKHQISLIPVDSEHSAIFQCLMGNDSKQVEKIILTASGGPFRGRTKSELLGVMPEDALKHPNWNMGRKITIDSATMMNKGLEVIEAKWLFDIDVSDIQVLVHPQSIVHSMVEYIDGSVIAQLGSPDMRLPIQFAFTYPNRNACPFSKLDLLRTGSLTFSEPDMESFRCLGIAFDAIRLGGSAPVVMNAANEIAVDLFLSNKIGFLDIPKVIECALEKHEYMSSPTLDDILEFDTWSRRFVNENHNN